MPNEIHVISCVEHICVVWECTRWTLSRSLLQPKITIINKCTNIFITFHIDIFGEIWERVAKASPHCVCLCFCSLSIFRSFIGLMRLHPGLMDMDYTFVSLYSYTHSLRLGSPCCSRCEPSNDIRCMRFHSYALASLTSNKIMLSKNYSGVTDWKKKKSKQ